MKIFAKTAKHDTNVAYILVEMLKKASTKKKLKRLKLNLKKLELLLNLSSLHCILETIK